MAQPKVTLTVIGTPSNMNFWVVDTQENADQLLAAGGAGVLVSMGDDNLSSWTQSRGIGDWSDLEWAIRMGKVIIALTPMVATSTKAANFIKELRRTLAGASASVSVQKIPAGGTIKKLLKDKPAMDFVIDLKLGNLYGDDESVLPPVEDEEASEADRLFAIAKSEFNFHWSDEDGGFLTLKNGPKFAYVVSGGTPNLKNYLVSKYLERYSNKVIPRNQVSDALASIEAVCDLSDSRVRKLSIRAAKSALTGRVWVDLGRRDGLLVCINQNGWGCDTKADPDVFFKRTDQVKELPIPTTVAPNKVKEILTRKFRPVFNISDAEFPMVCAWMANQIVPDWKAPIAMFLGESGSGKTTATAMISSLLEGFEDMGNIMPDKADDIAVTISQEKISLWNNVSNMSPANSDSICQYIDGSSYKKRKLRTDNDQVKLTLEPSILLNGIAFDKALREDVKDRSIIFNMDVMVSTGGSVQEMIDNVLKDHAELLGAVYTLVSQLMAEGPNVEMPLGLNRMSSYVRSVVAIDNLWELNGATLARYKQSSTDMSVESLDDPLFKIIHRLVVTAGNLREDGTYHRVFENSELFNLVTSPTDMANLRGILRMDLEDARSMTANINRKITDWKKFGVSYRNHADTKKFGARGTYKEFTFDPAVAKEAWMDHAQIVAAQRF